MAKLTEIDNAKKKSKKKSSAKDDKTPQEKAKDTFGDDIEEEGDKVDTTHLYADDLNGDVYTETNANPKAKVHATEWRKILNGDPVEINPSLGSGMKIMTVAEWTSRWKQNDRFPDCLACGSTSTKEHHFTQTWCRGKKKFESEGICMDCHMWSWRSYCDPDFLTPEEFDKIRWEKMVKTNEQDRVAARALKQ
jgi:hypothetical protein